MRKLPSIIATIVKMLLGMLFFFSAASKYVAIEHFELYIYSFDIFTQGACFVIARLVLALELLVGTMLISNRFHQFSCTLCLLMQVAFTAFLIYAIAIGRQDSCNCFGDLLPFTPVQSLIKNVILLALTVVALLGADTAWRPYWWLSLLMAIYPFELLIGLAYMGKVGMIVNERDLLWVVMGGMALMQMLSFFLLWPKTPFGQWLPNQLLWPLRRWVILPTLLVPFVIVAVVSTAPEDWKGGSYKTPFAREVVKSQLGDNGSLRQAHTYQGRRVVAFYSLHCPHCKATATKLHAVQRHNALADSSFVNVFAEQPNPDASRFFAVAGTPEYNHFFIDKELFAVITRGQFPLVLLIDGDSIYSAFGTAVPEEEIVDFLHP